MIKKIIYKLSNTKYVIILLIAITALAYANSLKNDFVWDDYFVVVDNNFIKSWNNFPAIFSKAYLTPLEGLKSGNLTGSGETTYRPVVTGSYFLDYWLWGLNPFGYHLSSLLLHIANVILLYLLARLLLNDKYIAVLAALFFAIHPVNTEAVNVISFREDLLAFLFLASAFILFIKQDASGGRKKSLYLILSAGLFLLALFSKEEALVFPVILVLYDYLFVFKQKWQGLFTRAAPRYLGYALAAIFYLAVWTTLKGARGVFSAEYPYPGGNFYTNFLTMSKVVVTYIFWLILPVNIHAILPENEPAFILHSIFNPEAFFSIILIILLLAVAFIIRKKLKEISFSILWFFILLLPVSNIIPISCVIAARYLYLPMAGFCIGLAVILFKIYNFKGKFFSSRLLKKFSRYTVVIILIFYFIFTAIRNLAWKNNIIVWQELVESSPGNAQAHINLGNQFKRIKLFDSAVNEYRIALKLNPGLAEAYNYWGMALGAQARYVEAANCFRKAIEIDKKYVCAYNNLAVNYVYMNKWDEASMAWMKVLEIDPENKEANHNLEKLKRLRK